MQNKRTDAAMDQLVRGLDDDTLAPFMLVSANDDRLPNPESWIIVNDAVEGLRGLPDGVVDCVVTSPPYFALRDYGVEGQIGLEQTPEAYIERLVEVFREVRRVLSDHGTLWVNIGDSYASSSHLRGGLKRKDLVDIPWMLAFALRADGWYLRSEVIWSKACGLPESVRDRPTRSHEKVFLLTKRDSYFFDDEAVKEPAKAGHKGSRFDTGKTAVHQAGRTSSKPRKDDGTRRLRDVWHLVSTPFKGAHFATMPHSLAETCIRAGSSERGKCSHCWATWERTTCHAPAVAWRPTCTCPHAEPVPSVVLDPFMGAGTTALVANRLGRHAVGTELNPDFAAIAQARLQDSGFCMGIDFQIWAATDRHEQAA